MKKTLLFSCLILCILPFSICGQESVADLIVQIKPSVVKITVLDGNRTPIKTGSGFFMSQTSIVTNKHVVTGGKYIEIRLYDGSILSVIKVRDVHELDISVLEIASAGRINKPLTLAARAPREGDKIIVFGNPLGLQGSVSDGLVSATRTINNKILMQITAPISPGSSGSPVLDLSGRVVGVATLNIEGGQNLNFAIPANQIVSIWAGAVSADTVAKSNINPVIAGARSQPDLTGVWLIGYDRPVEIRIIDDGVNVSVTSVGPFESHTNYGKWVGDVVIGRSGDCCAFTLRMWDAERLGMETWYEKWKNSDEKIFREMTRLAKKGRPGTILRRR